MMEILRQDIEQYGVSTIKKKKDYFIHILIYDFFV
jgi:hypothetical protein